MADYLTDQIHMAVIGDDLVVLDVTRDAYSCLVGGGSCVRFAPGGQLMIEDDAARVALREAGFLSAEPTRARRMPPPRPTVSGSAVLQRSPIVRERLRFACSATMMSRRYGQMGFAELIGKAQTPSHVRQTIDSEERVIRFAALFALWLPWIPGQGACLYRAFMLRQFLHRAGLHVDWVFGVATWPFSAHCWLQIGEVLLDDDVERVRSYTPIMVV